MAVSGIVPKTLTAVTVTTAGTRKQLSNSTLMVYGATIISLSTNTGTQYIGDSTVTAANGMPVPPDGTWEIEIPDVIGADQFDLAKWYVDSSTNAAEFRVIAWIRE